MKTLKDNKGSTLLVVLVLSAVALVIAAGLIYMVTEGTRMSGSSKQYKTALEAGRGCADLTIEYINSRPTLTSAYSPASVAFTVVNTNRLVNPGNGKLYTASATWPTSSDQSISIDPLINGTYDITCSFANSPYTSYIKITGTTPGNSGTGSGTRLHGGGTTDAKWAGGGAGQIQVVSYPYLYAVEILALNRTNQQERAKLSMLYQY